jgi:hypothetical protein
MNIEKTGISALYRYRFFILIGVCGLALGGQRFVLGGTAQDCTEKYGTGQVTPEPD